jgi:hypothetical protein
MGKFSLQDRLIYGSFTPRLGPGWLCNTALNQKLGPRLTDPLVRATDDRRGAVPEEHHDARMADTMFVRPGKRKRKDNPGY